MYKKSLLYTGIILFFVCFSPTLYAQNASTKWGKVTDDEWKMRQCVYDTTAQAIVLFNKGEIYLNYGSDILIKRHIRIKILSPNALEEGNVSLPYYFKGQNERITDVDAQTINQDGTGKAVVQKIGSSQIFEVEVDKDWRAKRFSFPNVKAGSILEYRYTTLSKDYFNLEAWNFQNHLPTLYSEFSAIIPEGLDYRFLMQGVRLLQKYSVPTNKWSLSHLPALKPEPYVANYRDYAEKIKFQLAGYTRRKGDVGGGTEYVNLMTTWEALADEILTDDRYTRYLNRHGKAKEIVTALLHSSDSDTDKIKKLYDFVKKTFHWNEEYRVFPNKSVNELLESGKGSGADINMMLTLLLREAGLEADPVLISTKDHGIIQTNYPFLFQFNHVLVNVRSGGKDQLLDAIDPFRPYTLLDESDLVKTGYLLDKKAPRWIEINGVVDSKQTVYVEADLSDLAKPTYKIDLRGTGYEALDLRRAYALAKPENFSKYLLKWSPQEHSLANLNVSDADEFEKPMVLTYQLTPENSEAGKASILYLKPILVNPFTDNPFKNELRNSPVEFDHPYGHTFVLNLKIPAGYQVGELPTSIRMSLPDKMADFSYAANATGEILQIRTTITFKAPMIPLHYYPNLREFYTQIIAKYNEQVVLKKL